MQRVLLTRFSLVSRNISYEIEVTRTNLKRIYTVVILLDRYAIQLTRICAAIFSSRHR